MKQKYAKVALVITSLLVFSLAGYYFFMRDDAPSLQRSTETNTTVDDTSSYSSDTAKSPAPDQPTTKPNDGPAPDLAAQPALDATFPAENAHYRIDQTSDSMYSVTLNAILNRPSDKAQYLTDLKAYKEEALLYLSERGITTSTAKIEFTQEDAKDL